MGLKVTLIVQEPLAGTLPAQGLVWAKSPLATIVMPTKCKLVLLSADESEQPPLAVSVLRDPHGRTFRDYYTLADRED